MFAVGFLLSLGSFGLLKQALVNGLAGLVGKTVRLEIYAADEKRFPMVLSTGTRFWNKSTVPVIAGRGMR